MPHSQFQRIKLKQYVIVIIINIIVKINDTKRVLFRKVVLSRDSSVIIYRIKSVNGLILTALFSTLVLFSGSELLCLICVIVLVAFLSSIFFSKIIFLLSHTYLLPPNGVIVLYAMPTLFFVFFNWSGFSIFNSIFTQKLVKKKKTDREFGELIMSNILKSLDSINI